MNEIGNDFKQARSSSSISIEEASADTDIPVEALEQIENGSIGSFKDIFKLKGYLQTYAKYLGLDSSKVIDEFNEYMFEYTSKIPLDQLEKKMEEQKKNEVEDDIVVSPYLKPKEEVSIKKYIIIVIVSVIVIAGVMIWAIKQVS